MCNFDRAAHTRTDGKLRAFTDVGCYPLFYLTRENDVLCASCANDEGDIVACDANYESRMYCDECSAEIESAYGVADDDAADAA